MRRTAALAIGIGLGALACAREVRTESGVAWVGHIGPETLEGRVRVVGNEPFPWTVVESGDGRSMIVTGALRGEIRRLAGAHVRVTGRLVQGELPDTTLEASSYEILSVDGDRPLLGRLERDAKGYYLTHSNGPVSRVTFVSDGLAGRVGALVWVVLDELGGVARYGVLRDAR